MSARAIFLRHRKLGFLRFPAEGPSDDQLLSLIEFDIPPDAVDEGGRSLMHLAAGAGALAALAGHGVPVDGLDRDGRSALWHAVDQQSAVRIAALLELGADPGRDDPDGPWALASTNADLASIDAFNAATRTAADDEDEDGRGALHRAADRGELATVEQLIAERRPIDARDKYGSTPLSLAARNGHERVVDALLEAGADAQSTALAGGTLLLDAVIAGSATLVRRFLDRGADPDVRFETTGAPVICVAAIRGELEILELLLDRGAEPVRKKKWDALSNACLGGQVAVARRLIDHGCDPKAGGYLPPMVAAARSKKPAIVKLLLDLGVSPNIAASGGDTPLQEAAGNDSAKIVELLLAAGASVEPDGDWKVCRALRYAAALGQTRAVKLIVQAGADPLRKDKWGLTAAETARKGKHRKLAQWLDSVAPPLA